MSNTTRIIKDGDKIIDTWIETSGSIAITTIPALAREGVQSIAGTSHLTVFADEIKIVGTVLLPGKNVFMFARVITTDGNATLSVTGAPGISFSDSIADEGAQGPQGADGYQQRCYPFPNPNAQDHDGFPGGRGQDGKEGSKGTAGDPGGKIFINVYGTGEGTLTLLAKGGDGGHGGRGGKGGKGGFGGRGCDYIGNVGFANGGHFDANCGGDGGPGGDGGVGGLGGEPGNGGVIRLITTSGKKDFFVLSSSAVNSGAPGLLGEGGDRGGGGDPGKGGKYSIEVHSGFGPGGQSVFRNEVHYKDSGKTGAAGNLGEKPKETAAGKGGVRESFFAMSSLALSPFLPLRFAQNLLTRADDAFLFSGGNSEGADALGNLITSQEIYKFLETVCLVHSEPKIARKEPIGPWKTNEEYNKELAKLGKQVEGLKSIYYIVLARRGNFRSGRDLFGYSASYVPRRSITQHLTYSDTLLSGLEEMENHLNKFLSKEQKSETHIIEGKYAIEKMKSKKIYLKTIKTNLIESLKATFASIKSQEQKVNRSKNNILDREDDYKRYLRSSIELDLGIILGIFETLAFTPEKDDWRKGVMFGSQIGKSFKELNDSFHRITGLDGQTYDTRYLINNTEAWGDSLTTLADASKFVNGRIFLSDPNGQLLLAKKGQLEELLKPFRSLKEARALEEAMDRFVEDVVARNNQVLEYNAIYGQIVYVQSEIDLCEAQVELLTSNLEEATALTKDNELIGNLLKTTYRRMRNDALRELVSMKKAFRFWSLQEADETDQFYRNKDIPDTITAKEIRSDISALKEEIERKIEERGTGSQWEPPLSLKSDGHGVWICFDEKKNRDMIALLKKGEPVTIELVPVRKSSKVEESELAGKSEIRLNKIRPWIKGPWNGGVLNVEITHSGEETIVDRSNQPHTYVHGAVKKTFKFNADALSRFEVHGEKIFEHGKLPPFDSIHEDVDISEETDPKYCSIGPFAKWIIQMPLNLNSGIDLNTIEAVAIEIHCSSNSFS